MKELNNFIWGSPYCSYNVKTTDFIDEYEEKACFSDIFHLNNFNNFKAIEYKIYQIDDLSERQVKNYVKKVCKIFGQRARFKGDHIVLKDIKPKYQTLIILSMIRLVFEYVNTRDIIKLNQIQFIRKANKWNTLEDFTRDYNLIAPNFSYDGGHSPAPGNVKIKTLKDFNEYTGKSVNDFFKT